MSALSIQVPFPVFQGRDGQPLENGYIWIGEPNLNPQTNPVVAYYDAALTIVAPQPLRTLNGYVSRAGTPAQIYVDGVNFSILVQDSKGSMVYNFPDGTGISPDACGVTYNPPFTGGTPTPVCEKLAEAISVKDFGASSSATAAANLAAFKLAVAAVQTGGSLIVPADASFYSIDTTGGLSTAIEIDKRMQIVFEGDVKANFGTQQANPPYIFSVTADNVTFTGGGGKIIGNGTIDDTNTGNQTTFPGLVHVSGDNFTMTGCIVDNPPKVGVLLYDCAGAKIQGNTFTGGPTINVYGNTAHFAIYSYLGGTHNISNNLFTPDSSGGMYINTIFFNGTTNSIIDSNVCVHPYEKLAYIVGSRNTVSNNQVIGNPNDIPGTSPAIKGTLTSVYRFDGAHNTCVGNYSDFCLAGVSCLASKGNLISGNTFLRNGQLGIIAFELSGYTGTLSETAITDNFLTFDSSVGAGFGSAAISVEARYTAARDVVVSNNTIIDFPGTLSGILIEGTATSKITNSKITGNYINTAVNGIIAKYVEKTVISDNVMDDIVNAMIVQLSTSGQNRITNNFSSGAAGSVDSGYSTDSTYFGNQFNTTPLSGLVTLAASATTVVSQGGVEINARVILQPVNASAATLVSGSKSPYVTISQPNFVITTADGTAAAGTEQFWYSIVQ